MIDALKKELTNDPKAMGYSAMTVSEVRIAINDKNIVRVKPQVTGDELFKYQDNTEYGALLDIKKSQWLSLCSINSFKPTTSVFKIVKDIYGNTAATSVAFDAGRMETISRAEELGLGRVRSEDIRKARAAE